MAEPPPRPRASCSTPHPSAFCEVTGLRPTFGRAPKLGVAPLGHSLDQAVAYHRNDVAARWKNHFDSTRMLLARGATGSPVPTTFRRSAPPPGRPGRGVRSFADIDVIACPTTSTGTPPSTTTSFRRRGPSTSRSCAATSTGSTGTASATPSRPGGPMGKTAAGLSLSIQSALTRVRRGRDPAYRRRQPGRHPPAPARTIHPLREAPHD